MSQISIVTATTLAVALENVKRASSEEACATALVDAASLLQAGIVQGQDTQSIMDAVEQCSGEFGMPLAAAMRRAVEFHRLDEGTMGMWLVPVVLNTEIELASAIAMTNGMGSLKASACLQGQLGLTSADGQAGGWVVALPQLLSENQLRDADLHTLVTLPMQVREMVRGQRKAVDFLKQSPSRNVSAGDALYFLPVVAYHPAGASIDAPAPSEQLVYRLTNWLGQELTAQFGERVELMRVGDRPQPFSTALTVGDHMLLTARFTRMMFAVSAKCGVAIPGMSALVAPYEVRSHAELVLGVSLVSRLTGMPLATLNLAIDSDDGEQEVALVTCVLKDLGCERVQRQTAPISTSTCQHCGTMQFAMPTAANTTHGIVDSGNQVH